MITEHKNKKKRKWLKYTAIALTAILLISGVYIISVWKSMQNAIDSMHEDHKTDKRETDISLKEKHPFSVLILGVDERENDVGRSDTMIVVTVNPDKNSIKMLSIPRDTRVNIAGWSGGEDKINHSYAYGGIDMSIDTVEEFLDIPIDYYIKLNMEGFKDLVDAVGGVTVYNDMDLQHGKYVFPKGEITLNGEEALVYSRIRYEDPRGDFGRQKRQKDIMQAILNEGASISTLWNYDDIFEALSKNIKTNLTFNEMVEIQAGYKSTVKNLEQYNFEKGSGGFLGNIWYYFPDEQEVLDFQHMLKEHLGLLPESGVAVNDHENGA